MYTWAGAAGPDAAFARWRGVKHVDGCPSTCVPALAALCPGLERLSISLEDSNGALYHDTAASLASLTGLTSLRIAFNRKGDPPRGEVARAPAWRPECAAALGALTRLRSLVVFLGGVPQPCYTLSGWFKGLAALTELQLAGRLPLGGVQLTGLRRLALEGGGFFGLGDQSAAIAASGPAQLTQLRCNVSNSVSEQLPIGPALAAATGLVHLSLPAARLAQGHLEALASAAPQLTRLDAASIAASDDCIAEFPQLRALAVAFDPGFAYNLAKLAPRLLRLELGPSKADTAAVILPVHETLRELVLRGAFKVREARGCPQSDRCSGC
jgi:hypothetical protein